MAVNKFFDIYTQLKEEVREGIYNDTMLLPTELELVGRFKTSRNTIRRAIAQLNAEGLVYSVKGRGVVILETSKVDKVFFKTGNFHGLKELSNYNEISTSSKLIDFKELTVSEELAKVISFHEGERIYKISRLRVINGASMMYDTSYFKKSILGPIDEKIAAGSIYEYIDQKLEFKIVASKSIMKVVSAKAADFENLDLGENNCVGEIENIAYTDNGRLFEHTFIRYIPNEYVMVSFAQR
ncbi:GntR family transcriptional regulator, trehalose operon transcriptional repressor [Enterococcus sp. 9E7_DIV0242]|uniref:GntR family transcriptional regulator, trehalose operon transcriptional repressor n=1 Tax=Candidatus Enterococcus clewellii TaxID=1834193 RepID=A0AAQ3VS68_9ENTE